MREPLASFCITHLEQQGMRSTREPSTSFCILPFPTLFSSPGKPLDFFVLVVEALPAFDSTTFSTSCPCSPRISPSPSTLTLVLVGSCCKCGPATPPCEYVCVCVCVCKNA